MASVFFWKRCQEKFLKHFRTFRFQAATANWPLENLTEKDFHSGRNNISVCSTKHFFAVEKQSGQTFLCRRKQLKCSGKDADGKTAKWVQIFLQLIFTTKKIRKRGKRTDEAEKNTSRGTKQRLEVGQARARRAVKLILSGLKGLKIFLFVDMW
jgi:hypothetical protein